MKIENPLLCCVREPAKKCEKCKAEEEQEEKE